MPDTGLIADTLTDTTTVGGAGACVDYLIGLGVDPESASMGVTTLAIMAILGRDLLRWWLAYRLRRKDGGGGEDQAPVSGKPGHDQPPSPEPGKYT